MFFHSYNDEIKVTFRSVSNDHKGFKLEYSTPNCDRNYTSEQGLIHHSGFTNCWITITVPANRTISLYFNHFSIYDSEQCTRNALQVRYLPLHLLTKSRLREIIQFTFENDSNDVKRILIRVVVSLNS